jgi:hypothetical protein
MLLTDSVMAVVMVIVIEVAVVVVLMVTVCGVWYRVGSCC